MITDERLMSNYLNGSVSALEELYRRNRRRVYEMAFAHTGDAPHSEQIVQLVFRRLHKTRNKFDTRYTVVHHLFVITRYEIVQFLKRSRRFKAEEWEDRAPELKASTVGTFSEEVKQQLGNLSPESMEALTIRFQEGLAFEEIAEKIGVRWSTS